MLLDTIWKVEGGLSRSFPTTKASSDGVCARQVVRQARISCDSFSSPGLIRALGEGLADLLGSFAESLADGLVRVART